MRTTATALLGILFTFTSHFALAQDTSQIQVLDVSYQGNGCPGGSVSATFAPAYNQFSVLYSDFTAQVGDSIKKDHVSCDITMRLRLPPGTALSVDGADFRGFVFLEPGVIARHKIDFQIGPDKLSTFGFDREPFRGPIETSYFLRAERPNHKPAKLHCHGKGKGKDELKIKIRTNVKLHGGSPESQGLMTVDSADGQVEQRYLVSLKKCN